LIFRARAIGPHQFWSRFVRLHLLSDLVTISIAIRRGLAPEFVRTAIAELTSLGDLVLDPFIGLETRQLKHLPLDGAFSVVI
jgi:hypothetical protein